MIKRLKDYTLANRKTRSTIATQVVPVVFGSDEATKRMVMHSAKRVINQHKDEIQELAYK